MSIHVNLIFDGPSRCSLTHHISHIRATDQSSIYKKPYSPSFLKATSLLLCFQMIMDGIELDTSQMITASVPSVNSCGVGAFLNVNFSVKNTDHVKDHHRGFN